MNLDDGGEKEARTWFGAVCSLFILSLVVVFTYIKVETLIGRKDVDILSTIKDYHFSDMDRFGYENGLNIAVAFTDYSHNREWQLDPTYGKLVFNSYSWYELEDSFLLERKPLGIHNCTRAELGLNEDREGARFLPIREGYEDNVELYQKKLICVDKEDMWIHGNYDSSNARQLNIQLQKCHDRPDCKSDDEIAEFLRGKFLFVFYNNILFNSAHYGQKAIVPESRILWLRINTQMRQTVPF